jgi:hypothetical protein
MDAPWIRFPDIPLGSIGWRMGNGEAYWYAYQDWFATQSEHVRALVIQANPEPSGWGGFYERTLRHHASRIR